MTALSKVLQRFFQTIDPTRMWSRSSRTLIWSLSWMDYRDDWLNQVAEWNFEITDLTKIFDDLWAQWSEHDLTKILSWLAMPLIWERSWMDDGDRWSDQKFGRIFDITNLTKILDESSRSVTWPRSCTDNRDHWGPRYWTDLRDRWPEQNLGWSSKSVIWARVSSDFRDHWSKQGRGRIFTFTDLTEILDWSSRSRGQPRSWTELRDLRDNQDLGRTSEITEPTIHDLGRNFEITQPIKTMDGSSRSLIQLYLGRVFEITQPPDFLDWSSRSPRQPGSWTDLRDLRENEDIGLIFEITDKPSS